MNGDSGLQQNPLWPSALGAVQAHFQRWQEQASDTSPGSSRARDKALTNTHRWSALAGDLTALGLDKSTRDTLLGWADSVASQSLSGPVKTRLLHPMEREMLTTESYGYLLDVYRLGLLGLPGFEQVLELCASLTRLPASQEQVEFLTQRVLSESITAQGFGTAH